MRTSRLLYMTWLWRAEAGARLRAEFMRMLATDGGGEADAGAVGGGPARGPRGAPNGYAVPPEYHVHGYHTL